MLELEPATGVAVAVATGVGVGVATGVAVGEGAADAIGAIDGAAVGAIAWFEIAYSANVYVTFAPKTNAPEDVGVNAIDEPEIVPGPA